MPLLRSLISYIIKVTEIKNMSSNKKSWIIKEECNNLFLIPSPKWKQLFPLQLKLNV